MASLFWMAIDPNPKAVLAVSFDVEPVPPREIGTVPAVSSCSPSFEVESSRVK